MRVKTNRVREFREQKYLTQNDLASMIGLQGQTIGNIETGRNRPRPKTMRLIAQALNVPIEVLFPLDTDEETNPNVAA